jgi:stalled ribosome rescue protein Dom34
MSNFHVAVWIDHNEARVFDIAEDSFAESTVRAPKHHVHKHPKGIAWEKSHPADLQKYFHSVVEALGNATEILILGPGNAKLELMRHVHSHDPALEKKIVGIETSDHPTDGELAKHARAYFNAEDRMRGLKP